jgi:hypothetical protein
MARPSLRQLAPTRTDGTLDRTFAVDYEATQNSNRRADRADLSLEWYFDEVSAECGRVLGHQQLHHYQLQENVDIGVIGNIGGAGDAPLLYDVSRPINGDNADVFGVELGAQHFFDNGIGFRVSYTYTDTKAYIDGVHVGQLEGVSESAYSVALMYEDDRWDAQLAADYSGKYTEVTDAVGGLSQIGDPIMWVTASVAYKLFEGFTVSLEGRNLADEFHSANLRRDDVLAGFGRGDAPIFSVSTASSAAATSPCASPPACATVSSARPCCGCRWRRRFRLRRARRRTQQRPALTPPLGWSSWNNFGEDISEQLVVETIDAMVANGMRDAGYLRESRRRLAALLRARDARTAQVDPRSFRVVSVTSPTMPTAS